MEEFTDLDFEDWDPNSSTTTVPGDSWVLPSSVDTPWEAVEEKKMEEVPAGVYNVVIETAEPKIASTGNRMVSYMLKITDGNFEGRKIFKNQVLTKLNANGDPVSLDPTNEKDRVRLGFIKSDFSICKVGLKGRILESVLDSLPSLPGTLVKVKVRKSVNKSGEEFTNVDFKENLGKMSQ